MRTKNGKQKTKVDKIPNSIDRLGVNDSGDWSFYLAPHPGRNHALPGAGWRLATVVCSKNHGLVGEGRGYRFS